MFRVHIRYSCKCAIRRARGTGAKRSEQSSREANGTVRLMVSADDVAAAHQKAYSWFEAAVAEPDAFIAFGINGRDARPGTIALAEGIDSIWVSDGESDVVVL